MKINSERALKLGMLGFIIPPLFIGIIFTFYLNDLIILIENFNVIKISMVTSLIFAIIGTLVGAFSD